MNYLWERYTPMFAKIESVLASCKTKQQLHCAEVWAASLIRTYRRHELKSHLTYYATVYDFFDVRKNFLSKLYAKKYSEGTTDESNTPRILSSFDFI